MLRQRNTLTENSTLYDDYRHPVIYRITNKIDGDCYIGSTSDFFRRKSCHLSLLKKGKHHSHRLQKAYNEMGRGMFLFEILEFSIRSGSFLRSKEIKWARIFNPYYNNYLTIPKYRVHKDKIKRYLTT